ALVPADPPYPPMNFRPWRGTVDGPGIGPRGHALLGAPAIADCADTRSQSARGRIAGPVYVLAAPARNPSPHRARIVNRSRVRCAPQTGLSPAPPSGDG